MRFTDYFYPFNISISNHSMNVRFLPIAIFSLLIIFSSCESKQKQEAQGQKNNKAKGPMKVDGFVVQSKPVSDNVLIPATIVAEEITDIHPQVSGLITGLFIKEGANVPKGTLLAKLYDADLQAQKKKDLVQLQINQDMAKRRLQLLNIGGISREDYESTLINTSSIKADLDVIQTSIEKTEIRAPFSGKLGLKQVSPGAYVTPASVLTTIQKTNSLRIDFPVPEKYANQLKTGDKVNFSTDAGKTFSAVVFATESGVQQTTRQLMIRARVIGDQSGLIPGTFAKVSLSFDYNPDALMVPTQAIIPQARGKQVIVSKNGTARFVDVTTGIRDSVNVEVLSGLHKGDTIVTTGLMSLKPNAKVVIRKISNH